MQASRPAGQVIRLAVDPDIQNDRIGVGVWQRISRRRVRMGELYPRAAAAQPRS
jgi:hypothetical protein